MIINSFRTWRHHLNTQEEITEYLQLHCYTDSLKWLKEWRVYLTHKVFLQTLAHSSIRSYLWLLPFKINLTLLEFMYFVCLFIAWKYRQIIVTLCAPIILLLICLNFQSRNNIKTTELTKLQFQSFKVFYFTLHYVPVIKDYDSFNTQNFHKW